MGKSQSEDASRFQGYKSVSVHPFNEQIFLSIVNDTSPVQFHLSNKSASESPAKSIYRQLQKLKCETILVEQNYTDRDYKSEFSVLYAKRFHVPSAHCIRLHFFSKKHRTIDLVESARQVLNLLRSSADYLGFCVVRPTEYNRIGRTVIRTPPACEVEAFHWQITCQASFAVHLFGHQLKVFGTPFIQQETQVGSCAHAALWVVSRYMHMLHYCDEFLPDEINDLAKARQPRGRYYPAESGLVPTQILDALHGMGLAAIHYGYFDLRKEILLTDIPPSRPSDGDVLGMPSAPDTKTKMTANARFIRKVVSPYVESGFPVILCLEKHAVVVVGHVLEKPNFTDPICSFVINDDSTGPYIEYPLTSRDLSDPYDVKNVTDIIAVLPHSAKLKGEFAEAAAGVLIKLFSDEVPHNHAPKKYEIVKQHFRFPTQHRLRTFLMRASEFQMNLKDSWKQQGLSSEAADKLLRLDFPQYIWICEVLTQENEAKQNCSAKLILDSTAAHYDRSVIAIFGKRAILIFDRQNPEAEPDFELLSTEWQMSARQLHDRRVIT